MVNWLWITVDKLWIVEFDGLITRIRKSTYFQGNPWPMPVAGYSGTPLLQKLGIKPGMKLLLINHPDDYYLLVEKDLRALLCRKNEIPDLVHLFVHSAKELRAEMKKIKPLYKKNTSLIIWVSWLKKSARIPTDVTEDLIRHFALNNGLVDVKVCAVNEQWSGLKLVVPLAKR